jgi:hypothetical protein
MLTKGSDLFILYTFIAEPYKRLKEVLVTAL